MLTCFRFGRDSAYGCLWAVTAALLLAPSGTAAQDRVSAERLEDLLAEPRISTALEGLRNSRDWTARFLVELGSIESPSGHEHERADRVARELEELGLPEVQVTDAPNVMARMPGRSGKAVVFVSTLDDLATVAMHQREADEPPRVEGDRVVGPGTNTSSVTASMVAAARALQELGPDLEHDLVFAGVAREETGLEGMHDLVSELGNEAVAYVDILGDGRTISYGALTIHWWRIEGAGPPGHTLGGGLPNVNQGLARAMDRILGWSEPMQRPAERTSVNIAMVRSGEVFNHKPAEGWFSLDLRSLEGEEVARMEEEVRRILAEVSTETGIQLRMEPEHLVPGGQIPGARSSPLVQSAEAVARHLGLSPDLHPAGSSNMNVAVAQGIPSIGLGGSRGGDRGHLSEWADIPAMMRTAEHVFLLALLLAAESDPVGVPDGT